MSVAHIHDLPDEILVKIFKYLDYFTLFSISKTCIRFERFYCDPLIIRKSYFDNQNACEVGWWDIEQFLICSNCYITHLDISYVHWLPIAQLRKSLLRLFNLKHLNVIETNLRVFHVKEIVTKHQSLKSVAMSLTQKDLGKLREVWMAVDFIHFFVRSNLLQDLMTKYFSRRHEGLIVKLELSDEIERFENFFPRFWRQLMTKNYKRYILINNKCPSSGHNSPHRYNPLIFRYRNTTDPVTHHIFIETYDSIHLSSHLCRDIVDSEFVRHYATYFTIQQHYVSDPCTIYICKANADETKILEAHVRERVRLRTSEICYVKRYECYLNDETPILNHFKEKKSLKRISMDECYLCLLAAEEPLSNSPLFKKLRTSRIPQVPKGKKNVFRKMLDANVNLESLKILTDGSRECYKYKHIHEAGKLVLDTSSLIDVAKLSRLKHLSLTVLPENPREFFTQVFTHCRHLEYIGMYIDFGFHYPECLTELLHLCKNIKVLRMHCEIRKIDLLLANLVPCTSLEVVEIVDKLTVTQKKQRITLLHLLRLTKSCRKLRFLKIEQHDLNQRDIEQYKRFEHILRSKDEYIFVNLSDFSKYIFFKLNTYSFDITVM